VAIREGGIIGYIYPVEVFLQDLKEIGGTGGHEGGFFSTYFRA
jgi:hypothetical protein